MGGSSERYHESYLVLFLPPPLGCVINRLKGIQEGERSKDLHKHTRPRFPPDPFPQPLWLSTVPRAQPRAWAADGAQSVFPTMQRDICLQWPVQKAPDPATTQSLGSSVHRSMASLWPEQRSSPLPRLHKVTQGSASLSRQPAQVLPGWPPSPGSVPLP